VYDNLLRTRLSPESNLTAGGPFYKLAHQLLFESSVHHCKVYSGNFL